MSDSTELHLPQNLPYPIKILPNLAPSSASVQRGTRLLDYSWTFTPQNAQKEVRYGSWDSSVEGTIEKWNFKPGETISQRRARDSPALYIIEPCKHGVQLGGLCCLCGKDMTNFDYMGFSDSARASIQMTHSANGPTVSFEEAQRIERETANHLLLSRKLSLIVDLDQTIVHATVDPTVGEWIAEGEAWEARQAKLTAAPTQNGSSAGTDSTISDSDDEVNPNWEALKDVRKFKLGPEALGQHDHHHGPRRKPKNKSVENEGCMYYIKPRPGWQEFLRATATKYEMHVYTMGTRAYAEEVCAAIDPEGKHFGGRILSRDESGSLTQKSLQRLFPCDQSMVVIIDDRADVWEWSPNLVKVIPYDFFVGIGDINSTFLPKIEHVVPELPPDALITATQSTDSTNAGEEEEGDAGDVEEVSPSQLSDSTPPPSSSPEDSLTGADSPELTEDEIFTRNTMALDAQVEERPLAKKQEELLEGALSEETPESATNGEAVTTNGATSQAETVKSPKHARKALLKNDDVELTRVQKLLDEVHTSFYDAYDARDRNAKPDSRKSKRKQEPHKPYDVRSIIPQIRYHTLDGVHLLFSSVIPLDTRPESTDIWKTATAFGAHCYTELNNRITHVVAAKRGTVKVDTARRQGGIKIVWLSWFTDSIAYWKRQDETPYLMDPENQNLGPASPPSPSDAHQISSDPEPDADDWDDDRRNNSANNLVQASPGRGGGSAGAGSTGVEGGGGIGTSSTGTPGSSVGGGEREGQSLKLDEVDWDEINNEVEAAMNESDDEDDEDEGNQDDDGFLTDESNSIISVTSTPRGKRKRLRSVTPSDMSATGVDRDVLRSPLAKRKKLAADRSGASKLKEAFSAADIAAAAAPKDQTSKASTPNSGEDGEGGDEEEEEEGIEIDMDDDFLTRELGEDWG